MDSAPGDWVDTHQFSFFWKRLFRLHSTLCSSSRHVFNYLEKVVRLYWLEYCGSIVQSFIFFRNPIKWQLQTFYSWRQPDVTLSPLSTANAYDLLVTSGTRGKECYRRSVGIVMLVVSLLLYLCLRELAIYLIYLCFDETPMDNLFNSDSCTLLLWFWNN